MVSTYKNYLEAIKARIKAYIAIASANAILAIPY